jgi:hypothetical protein
LWSILQNARKKTISPTFIPQPEAQFSLFAPEPDEVLLGHVRCTHREHSSRVRAQQPNWLVGFGHGNEGLSHVPTNKTDQGCHIVTEEVVRGEGAIKLLQEQPNAMHDGHDLWLKVIKVRSEKRS